MARRNRSAAEVDTRAPDAHSPSSPSRPPVVCVYCRREDNPDKVLIVSWASYEGAASFFEAVIANETEDPKWLKHPVSRFTELAWPSGLRVRCQDDDALEKLAETGTTWTLPEPYVSSVRQFLGDAPVVGADHERRPKERGEAREPRAKKDKAPRASNRPNGFVHVSELVPDVSPPHARAALRSLKWDKPEYGWWFAPSDAARVSKAIKGALK